MSEEQPDSQDQILVWKVTVDGQTNRFDDIDVAVEFISGEIKNEKNREGAVLESERMTREEYLRAVELEDAK